MNLSQRLAVLALGLAIWSAPWTAHASSRSAGSSLVRTSFHLQVSSNFSPSATFWIAYGPLGGRFGLIRLHRAGDGRFVAAGWFPSGARADFYYIEGQGTMRTKEGVVPGNPVRTVGHAGPLIIGHHPVPVLRLSAPAG